MQLHWKTARNALEGNTVRSLASLGRVALVMLVTTVYRIPILAGQICQTLVVHVHQVTFVQLDRHILLHVKVGSTIPGGHKVSAWFVHLVISVLMHQPTSQSVQKDFTAPMDQHHPHHALKDPLRTSLWVIKLTTAPSVPLDNTVSSVDCLNHQVFVLVAGFVLVAHGKGCLSAQVT